MAIHITVSAAVECPAERVVAVLHDVEAYPRWWPVRADWSSDGGGHLLVRPLPFVAIRMDRVSQGPRTLRFDYANGPFRGTGTWSVSAARHGGGCEVSYAIALTPANRLAAVVARTPMFRLKHRWDIRRIIAALAARAC